MIFQFKRAKNGYVVEVRDPEFLDSDEVIVCEEEAYDDEHEAFKGLLYSIAEHYGPSDGRYSPKRLRILTMPGDKFEGTLDDEQYEHLLNVYSGLQHIVRRERNRRRKS